MADAGSSVRRILTDAAALARWLDEAARDLECVAAGCVTAAGFAPAPVRARFAAWCAAGNRGLLPYLDRTAAARIDPFAARPWAGAALVLTFGNAWHQGVPLPLPPPPARAPASGRIAAFAAGPDYHRTGARLLAALETRLAAALGTAFEAEPCVDAAPAPDSALAVAAGLGTIGWNGLLRAPDHGARVFVATLFVAPRLPPVRRVAATAAVPPCRDCGACARNCPTGALRGDGPVRVGECRSFLSIEYRGALSAAQQVMLGDALFGCDACTAVCPPPAPASGQAVDLAWILEAPTAALRRAIRGTALERAGPTLLRRNAAAIVAQRWRDPAGDRLLARTLAASGSAVVRDTIRAARPGL